MEYITSSCSFWTFVLPSPPPTPTMRHPQSLLKIWFTKLRGAGAPVSNNTDARPSNSDFFPLNWVFVPVFPVSLAFLTLMPLFNRNGEPKLACWSLGLRKSHKNVMNITVMSSQTQLCSFVFLYPYFVCQAQFSFRLGTRLDLSKL